LVVLCMEMASVWKLSTLIFLVGICIQRAQAQIRPTLPQFYVLDQFRGCYEVAEPFCPLGNETYTDKMWATFDEFGQLVNLRFDTLWPYGFQITPRYFFTVPTAGMLHANVYYLETGNNTLQCLSFESEGGWSTDYLQTANYTGLATFNGQKCYSYYAPFTGVPSITTYVSVDSGIAIGWNVHTYGRIVSFLGNFIESQNQPIPPAVYEEPVGINCATQSNRHKLSPFFQ